MNVSVRVPLKMSARHTSVCDVCWQWEINHTGPRSCAGRGEHIANYLYPWKLILDTTDLLTAAAESFCLKKRKKGLLLNVAVKYENSGTNIRF